MFKNTRALFLARTGVIAAFYYVLTVAVAPLSYLSVQFRFSEALTILPIFFIEAIPGLSIGCLLANIPSPNAWYDVPLGTLATLIASVLTYVLTHKIKFKNKNSILLPFVGGFPPILVNTIMLPLMWLLFSNDVMFWYNMGMIALSQTAVIYGLGIPLYFGFKGVNLIKHN